MREILDAILALIGAESLTDPEYAGLGLEDLDDQVANYNALDAMLDSRESVSDTRARLRYYYLARGAAVGELDTGKSNILIGAEL